VNLLLDTCTFLWLILDAPELSATARDLFRSPEQRVYLSAVSAWEIAVKHRLGRLSLPVTPGELVSTQRAAHAIEPLALVEEAVAHLGQLPDHHRDPFDRLLVCQAIEHGLAILTPDPLISRYPVRVAW
jgi:PIN domain nuclease of toxin-antitoxin system